MRFCRCTSWPLFKHARNLRITQIFESRKSSPGSWGILDRSGFRRRRVQPGITCPGNLANAQMKNGDRLFSGVAVEGDLAGSNLSNRHKQNHLPRMLHKRTNRCRLSSANSDINRRFMVRRPIPAMFFRIS
jgi:hypothetical protein